MRIVAYRLVVLASLRVVAYPVNAIDGAADAYTQSLPTRAPYPDFVLAGTSTLDTHYSATMHFLASW